MGGPNGPDERRVQRAKVVALRGLPPGRRVRPAPRPVEGVGAPFVGRERERAELGAAFEAALGGRGGLILVSGEAGIGKTRLLTEFAAEARARSAGVAWGRSFEGGGAPAFWPWIEVLRELARGAPARGVAAGDPVTALLDDPHVGARGRGAASRALRGEAEEARFRLFEACAARIAARARERPLVLLLDDLQAADLPSLLLLRFVAPRLGELRALAVGAAREDGARRSGDVPTALADLYRVGTRLALAGLDAAAVAQLARHALRREPGAELLAELLRTSEGNPFYLDELLRRVAAGTDAAAALRQGGLALPGAVRELLARRLEPLARETRRALDRAAVLGREFDLAALAALARLPRKDLIARLEDAVAAGVVQGEPEGRWRFTHELVRETLYRALSANARERLHLEAGEVLESLAPDDAGPRAAAIALHFLAADPALAGERAIAWAVRAARAAEARLAHEEAARLYERALRAARANAAQAHREGELLLACGAARRRAGEGEGARAILLECASLARARGDAELLGRAALEIGNTRSQSGQLDRTVIELLEEALARLGDGNAGLRAQFASRLAHGLYFSQERARVEALSREAVSLAREKGDREMLLHTLSSRQLVLWTPDTRDEQLEVCGEVSALARDLGAPELAAGARMWRMVRLLEGAALAELDVEIERFERETGAWELHAYRWQAALLRGTRALMEGRFDEAERRAREGAENAERSSQRRNAGQFFAVQSYVLARERGELARLEPAVRRFASDYPTLPIWRCGLAHLLLELGRREEAARELAALAARGFAAITRDGNWMAASALLAEVAAELGDAERAATLYDALLPYEGQLVVVATGAACLGPVSQFLGLLARALGRRDAAQAHVERALADARRLGIAACEPRVRFELARLAVDAGRKEEARAQLSEALSQANAIGMTALAERLAAFGASLGPPRPATLRAAAVRLVFLRDGGVWLIGAEAAPARVIHAKGLAYIAELLRRPASEVHAGELVAAHEGKAPERSDAGEVIDRRALAEYRTRLRALEEELEEARERGDLGRSERLAAEAEMLRDELSGALGIGGRRRRAGASSERTRVRVRKAIERALERIASADAALGAHLSRQLRTGAFCAYVPDPLHPVDWQL